MSLLTKYPTAVLFIFSAIFLGSREVHSVEYLPIQEIEENYIVNFRSNGSERFMLGPNKYDRFPEHLEAEDLAKARSGPFASIVPTLHPDWMKTLPSDPNARWISTNPSGNIDGSTAVYAKDFNLEKLDGLAELELRYSVDDRLGDWISQGIFLNGEEVPCLVYMAGFQNEYISVCKNIEGLLKTGVNTLYLYDINLLGPSGIIFSGKVTILPISKPTSTPTETPTSTPTETETENENQNESITKKPSTTRIILIIGAVLLIGTTVGYFYSRNKLR